MPDLEIMWTKVDEAPALATYSLLPIVEAFVGAAGVSVKLKDISLAGRILAPPGRLPGLARPGRPTGASTPPVGPARPRPSPRPIGKPERPRHPVGPARPWASPGDLPGALSRPG